MDYGVAVVLQIARRAEARDGIEVDGFPSVGRKYDSDRSLKDYVKVSEDSSVKGILGLEKLVPWAPAVEEIKDYDADEI